MSSEYKLLIFDWDGTLADSIGRIVTSMQEAAQRAGRAERDDEAIKGIIGLGLPAYPIAASFPIWRQAGDCLPSALCEYLYCPGCRAFPFVCRCGRVA